jgi:hypothetical protein
MGYNEMDELGKRNDTKTAALWRLCIRRLHHRHHASLVARVAQGMGNKQGEGGNTGIFLGGLYIASVNVSAFFSLSVSSSGSWACGMQDITGTGIVGMQWFRGGRDQGGCCALLYLVFLHLPFSVDT